MPKGSATGMNRILLIEDDAIVAKVILYYLKQAGNYKVEWVKTAGEALAAARMPFDLMLLDICLPDVDGVELCARLRETVYCPIIFISCMDDEDTIVRALEIGGDDYITKPFSAKTLETRIEATSGEFALSMKNARMSMRSGLSSVISRSTARTIRCNAAIQRIIWRRLSFLSCCTSFAIPIVLYHRTSFMKTSGEPRALEI